MVTTGFQVEEIVSDNMRRNRFEKILLFLHVADSNNLPKDKKVGRVSEYLDELQKNFKTHCIWDREFDINERMVEYFGRYGTFLKQSIRMKPIRFGYKIWCANLPLGYLFDFTIYEGSTGRKTDNITNFGLGAGVVFDIIDGLPVDSDGNVKPMLFSVENVFNSFQLIDQCSLRNIPIISTLKAGLCERSSHFKQERCSEERQRAFSSCTYIQSGQGKGCCSLEG